jgi:CheY-like chemotaxis protein
VVDDNATNQRLLALILQGAGMQVRLADNGLEGLEAYQAAAFDAVLMDIQMPVMDGLEATAAIRAFEVQNGRRRTPILIVSANAAPENIAAGRAAGADGHLSKPVTAARLLDALAQLGDSGEEDQNSDLDAVA